MQKIPFNHCVLHSRELEYVTDVVESGRFGVDGTYRSKCEAWLKSHFAAKDVILTQSCTDALEMAAMLSGVGPEDEVILPSFTFSSTANAFALRRAKLVFVDIDPVTLNIDPKQVEQAVTDRTKVIVPVDYAGMPCDIAEIKNITSQQSQNIMIAEDAAQALMAYEGGEAVGSKSDVSTLSFHNTKNIACGEGGALIINNPDYVKRSHILSEKGTNRKAFFLGEVDKYSWVDVGTSALPSEMTAAYLFAQLESAGQITDMRQQAWGKYYNGFESLEKAGLVKRPVVPVGVTQNSHMFYLLLETRALRDKLIYGLREHGITAPFHYIPLHSAPAGLALGRAHGGLEVTNSISSTLIRMPMWNGVHQHVDRVVSSVEDILRG